MMRRRRFLQIAGAAAAAAAVRFPLAPSVASAAPLTTTAGGRVYRGDASGYVYVSADGGKTWTLHTYLGPGYSVLRLATDKSKVLRMTVGYAGRTFELRLGTDTRSWLTR